MHTIHSLALGPIPCQWETMEALTHNCASAQAYCVTTPILLGLPPVATRLPGMADFFFSPHLMFHMESRTQKGFALGFLIAVSGNTHSLQDFSFGGSGETMIGWPHYFILLTPSLSPIYHTLKTCPPCYFLFLPEESFALSCIPGPKWRNREFY